MTCADYRTRTNTPASAVTRAERASFLRHCDECPACHDWTMATLAGQPVSRAEWDEFVKLYGADLADPEYRAVAEGK